MAVADALDDQPAKGCGACGDHSVHPDRCRRGASSDRRTGVEAEPTEPQQPSADHDQRQVVGAHRIALPAQSLAEDDGKCQASCGSVDMNRGATCEVNCL